MNIAFPDELTVAVTRDFHAPIGLVFDVMTKPEHVRKTFAPFDETVTECTIDLRPGGSYRYVMVTPDGIECAFRGTFSEIQPPVRTVCTWLFEGWPDAPAVETMELHEAGGVTTLTRTLAFKDKAGRAWMTEYDAFESNLDKVDALVKSLRSP